jgi:excisionase family DNA binding protein
LSTWSRLCYVGFTRKVTEEQVQMDKSANQPAIVYTIEEAAKLLKLGRNSAYEAARNGDIPTLRIGRRLLVPRAALDRLLAGEVA